MSHYTNPAFCQKSEYLPRMVPAPHNFELHPVPKDACKSMQMKLQCHQYEFQEKLQQRKLPPTPGPKPTFRHNDASKMDFNSSGYALVPLDEIPRTKRDNYAILPSTDAYMMQNSSMRLAKSQDNLDCVSPNRCVYEEEDSFTSLPAYTCRENSQQLVPAFSTDFINKSMILVGQNGTSMQRYAIVPTDDDEEVVDSNTEIIEMHNGRVHRYAVIPTDEDANCIKDQLKINTKNVFNKYQRNTHTAGSVRIFQNKIESTTAPKPFLINEQRLASSQCSMKNLHAKPQLNGIPNVQNQLLLHTDEPSTSTHGMPSKNSIATQKLHELLSTPRKSKQERLQRHGSYQTIISKSPNQFQLQELYSTRKSTEFTPQKLQYDDTKIQTQNIEQRTTAVISPRLHQQTIYNETTLCNDKTLPHVSFQKVESATATIGIISLMLILTGILNSGLCLYMVTDMRRSYYLDLGIISGFAAAALGIMGFRSRQCYWLPNRNYISGYVLVTIFSLLNCCGLLVLLGLNPFPGTPFHDLTTGVILALSSLMLLIISLGVITSKWCIAPPPDNRVHVY